MIPRDWDNGMVGKKEGVATGIDKGLNELKEVGGEGLLKGYNGAEIGMEEWNGVGIVGLGEVVLGNDCCCCG